MRRRGLVPIALAAILIGCEEADCADPDCALSLVVTSAVPDGTNYLGAASGVVEVDGARRTFVCGLPGPCDVQCEADCSGSTVVVQVVADYTPRGTFAGTRVEAGHRDDGAFACRMAESVRIELTVGETEFQPFVWSNLPPPEPEERACGLVHPPTAVSVPWYDA